MPPDEMTELAAKFAESSKKLEDLTEAMRLAEMEAQRLSKTLEATIDRLKILQDDIEPGGQTIFTTTDCHAVVVAPDCVIFTSTREC